MHALHRGACVYDWITGRRRALKFAWVVRNAGVWHVEGKAIRSSMVTGCG